MTLLGTTEDYKQLRAKIDRLLEFDLEEEQYMVTWHAMLAQIIDQFVAASEGEIDEEFWSQIISYNQDQNGDCYTSGWGSVFAAFNSEGKWQGTPETLIEDDDDQTEQKCSWPRIPMQDIPSGSFSVSMAAEDDGAEYQTRIFAG